MLHPSLSQISFLGEKKHKASERMCDGYLCKVSLNEAISATLMFRD